MSGFFNCPWCGYEMNGWDMFEDEDVYHVRCRSCGKPVLVRVEIEMNVEADKDASAIEAEKELYEKRMKGDWS